MHKGSFQNEGFETVDFWYLFCFSDSREVIDDPNREKLNFMPFSRDNPFTGETFLGEFPGGYTDNSGIAIETRNIKNSIFSKQFK